MTSRALHQRALLLAATLGLLAGASACGGDSVGPTGITVGGPCQAANDCDQTCLNSGDWPDGTCVTSCDTDADCPDGTHCIDTNGGVCLLACQTSADCRANYECDAERNKGHGGDSLICKGDN